MGAVSVPPGGLVYIDANALYSLVERVQPYVLLLDVFWQDGAAHHRPALTSKLTALEALVAPLKAGDATLEALFRQGPLRVA